VINYQTQPYYDQHTGQPLLAGTSVKNWRILLEQTFTAHMPLLIATREMVLEFSSMTLPSQSPYH